MTSVVQQANKPSHTRNSGAPQTGRPTHLPSNAAGTSSPALPGAEEKHSPSPSALKRPPPPNAFRPPTMSGAVESTPPPDSNSLLNGKNTTATAAPSLSGPTIVNGNSIDHSRKSSFTVAPSNAANFGSNGGPVGAAQTKANNIQFGSMNNAGSPAPSQSPALGNQSSANLEVASLNPRIASPQTSPSPIPQLAASGGRPPPSLQGQGNGVSFGQIGEDGGDANRSVRSMPQGGMGPGSHPIHLRRDSSHSSHSELGHQGMPSAPARGGYPMPNGRGRGYTGQYPSQMAYSPSQPFRPPPNGRGMQNMQGGGFHAGRPQVPYPGSPGLANRSPAMVSVGPNTPQMGQVQMIPGMPGQFNAYPSHMGGSQVNRQFSSSHSAPPRGNFKGRKQGRGVPAGRGGSNFNNSSPHGTQSGPPYSRDPASENYRSPPLPPAPLYTAAPLLPPTDLSPESGNFERFLTMKPQGHVQLLPDPSIQMMYQHNSWMHQQQMYGGVQPQSPRPPYAQGPSATYMQPNYSGQGQTPLQSQPLSRTPSQMSGTERPGSSLGQSVTPSIVPASGHAPGSRNTSSPAPKPNFTVPKKSAPIVIKNPQGEVINFTKPAPSPVAATPPPPKPATPPTASTPRSQSTSVPDLSHHRTESLNTKTDEEKRQEAVQAVGKKRQEDEAKARREKEGADSKASPETEAKDPIPTEASKDVEPASAKHEEDEEAKLKSEEVEQTEQAPVENTTEEPPAAAEPADDEIDYDAIEAELAAQEEEEARREAEYQKKKAAEREAQKQKELEEEATYEANMKQMEREAEEREEEELAKKREAEGQENEESKKMFENLKSQDAPTPPSHDSPVIQTPVESGTATPVSDISMGPPARANPIRSKRPAELTLNTTKAVEDPQPSAALKALKSARFLDDPSKIDYPSAIASPNPALNANAPPDRKFKYNKEFLLQFQSVFREKPSLDWDARIRETLADGGETTTSARSSSARTPSAMGNRSVSNRPSVVPSFGQMGTFGATPRAGPPQLPPGTTSAQRFAMSNAPMGGRNPVQNPFEAFGRSAGIPVGGPSMSRSGSANPLGGLPASPRVGGSTRGGNRAGSKRDKQSLKKLDDEDKSMPLTAGMDLRAITTSQTGWKPRSVGNALSGPALGGDGLLAPDVVQRKVKANLNKMTPEKFDKIADQILEIAAQSKDESDGRTLRQVIQLTFEKATDEAHWAPMYAMFCKRMLESMSPDIKDENIKDKHGNVVTGGNLFRKYLLNRCQEEFERGWKVNLPTKPEGQTEEAVLLSDEYYIAAAAKRRGLGLVKFIGELYKLGMLTERIMHECIKKLLDYEGIPDEAEVESLTSLLRTVGANLDNPESKGQPAMNVYFDRIQVISRMPELPSRLQFMLMDVIDLRRKGWRSKEDNKGPKTIQEIREEAQRATQEAEAQRLAREANRGGGRMPMGRGDARSFSYGQMAPPDHNSNRIGTDDLRRLGNRASRNPSHASGLNQFGPSSLLSGRTNSGRRNLGPGGTLLNRTEGSGNSSRTGTPPQVPKQEDKRDESSTNTFSALAALEGSESLAASPPSNASSPPTTKSRPNIEQERSPSPDNSQE